MNFIIDIAISALGRRAVTVYCRMQEQSETPGVLCGLWRRSSLTWMPKNGTLYVETGVSFLQAGDSDIPIRYYNGNRDLNNGRSVKFYAQWMRKQRGLMAPILKAISSVDAGISTYNKHRRFLLTHPQIHKAPVIETEASKHLLNPRWRTLW